MKRKRQLTQKNDTNTFSVNQPRCTICLQGFTNRTFVRDCFHSFCFVCIRQWINITPDCPLCKSAIQALIYNIVEDLNSYQEYRLADKKPNTTKHHPSSTPCTSMAQRHLQIRPWLKRRQVLYRYLPTVITYPPPQPHLSSITIIQPQHMPKVIPFLQSELQAILGTAYDSFIETHLQNILLIPHNTNNNNKKSTLQSSSTMTMYHTEVVSQLSDWLNEDDRVIHRLLDECLAYLKSGLNYMTFINTAQYETVEQQKDDNSQDQNDGDNDDPSSYSQ